MSPDSGVISLLPTLVVIVLAIVTRRPLQSLLCGVLTGHLILSNTQFISAFADGAVKVMSEPTTGWLIIMIGLFGSLIALLVRSGGALAFSEIVTRRVANRTQAVLTTWLLGLIIFIDDYLNALAVSATMKKMTDHFKVSREMLAYIVDSTAAPICILVPLTSWAVYVIGLLESGGYAAPGEGFSLYLLSIPYMLYAWIAVLLVPLVGSRALPAIGGMKAAEARAQGGQPLPAEALLEEEEGCSDSHALNFFLPILVMAFSLWLFQADLLQSLLVTVSVTALLYAIQKLLTWSQVVETTLQGFSRMLPVLGIVIVSFMLRDLNNELGLASYVIATVTPLMSPQLMPAITFIALALIAFASGSFWGVYAVALPIVIPLAQSMDMPLPLVIGAVVSAGAFGSHACFYGDATVLSAQGSGCSPMAHALTQLPYAVIAALLSTIGFYFLV